MAYNFGAEIKKVLKNKGMSVSEFARRINKSRENAYDIFKRKSIDTDLINSISQVLDFDFLADSRDKRSRFNIAGEPKAPYGHTEHEMMLIREEMLILRREIVDLRKRIVTLEAFKKPRKK